MSIYSNRAYNLFIACRWLLHYFMHKRNSVHSKHLWHTVMQCEHVKQVQSYQFIIIAVCCYFSFVIISKLISVTSTLVHCLAFTWCCRVIVFDISEKVTQKQISTMFQLSVLLHFNVYDSPRPMHKFHFQGHLPHTANALPHLSVSRIQNNIAIL